MKIGIVGPCASGKTTLVRGLQSHDVWGKHIAQEHSYVPDMWQRISHPDILIYLDVSFPTAQQRRKMDWTLEEFLEQNRRLEHARQHADLIIQTDNLTPGEVLNQVLDFLSSFKSQNNDRQERSSQS